MSDFSKLQGRRVTALHVTAVCDDGMEVEFWDVAPRDLPVLQQEVASRMNAPHPELPL